MSPSLPDLLLPGLVVPASLLSLGVAGWAGVWTYLTKQRMALLESQLRQQDEAFRSSLRRQEEAFRLVHSPRVTGALKLWAAFCDFERALRRLASPGRVVTYPPDATQEQRNQAHRDQLAREREEFSAAWIALKTHHDEAEVLLPADVFARFEALQTTFEKIYSRKRSEDFIRDDRTRNEYEAQSFKVIEE